MRKIIQLLLACYFCLSTAWAQVIILKSVPTGYYTGTTSENLPMGFFVENVSGSKYVTTAKVQFKLYNSSNVYLNKDTTITFGFNSFISSNSFTAGTTGDSLCFNCDVPIWNMGGNFNFSGNFFLNATGTHSWNNNSSDPGARRTGLGVTWTADDIGANYNSTGPSGVVATPSSSSSIQVSWSAFPGATVYYVYRSTSAGGTYTYQQSSANSPIINTGLSPNTTYYYKVIGYTIWGLTAYSSEVSATTAPATPVSLTSAGQSASQIQLSWAASLGASSYNVYRYNWNTSLYQIIKSGNVPTTYTDTGLTANTLYYYAVEAVSASGASPKGYTNTYTLVSAPTSVTASAQSASSIALSWGAVSGATGYDVSRSASAGGVYSVIGSAVSTSYTSATLSANTRYFYKILAKNSYGSSAPSDTASAITWLAAPTGVVGTGLSDTSIQISWTATSGALSYEVWQSTSSGGVYSKVGSPLGTAITIAPLSFSTTYYYKIKAVNATSTSAFSTFGTGTTLAPPNPTITITSPNTSQTWHPDSIKNITWTYTGSVGQVNLFYSPDSGSTWISMASSLTNTGMYAWTVPSVTLDSVYIKIEKTGDPSVFDVSDKAIRIRFAPLISTNPTSFNLTQLTGQNQSPTSFKVWNSGSGTLTYTLSTAGTWLSLPITSGTSTGEADSIPLQFSTSLLDSGNYMATINVTDPSAGNSPQVITVQLNIAIAPKITVISPNGGETFKADSMYNLNWMYASEIPLVKVLVSFDSLQSWKLLFDSLINTGTVQWLSPDTLSQKAFIKVVALNDTSVVDVSNQPFSLNNKPNTAPAIILIDTLVLISDTTRLVLKAIDLENQPVSFGTSPLPPWISFSGDSLVTFVPPAIDTTFLIKVWGMDIKGLSDTSMLVLVVHHLPTAIKVNTITQNAFSVRCLQNTQSLEISYQLVNDEPIQIHIYDTRGQLSYATNLIGKKGQAKFSVPFLKSAELQIISIKTKSYVYAKKIALY